MPSIRKTFSIILITFVFIGFPESVFSSSIGWKNFPKRLKHETGIVKNDKWIFVTGNASIENIRQDKAHELARKKSLLHALRLLHAATACDSMLSGLGKKDLQIACRAIAPIVMPLQIQGVQVVRQWEEKNRHFTAVAVSEDSLPDFSCPFHSFADAAEKLIEQKDVTLDSLELCLRQVPWHSSIARNIRKKISKKYDKNDQFALSMCILPVNLDVIRSPITCQMRLKKAKVQTDIAKRFSKKKQWDKALKYLNDAFLEMQTYPPANLLIGEYWLTVENRPIFARCAAEKALESGTGFTEGIGLMVQCLNALDSPEAEVYRYLLDRSEKSGRSGYPAELSWRDFVGIDLDIPSLVLNSAGYALSGLPGKPGQGHARAVKAFNAATTDADIQKTLRLLFKACEEKPYVAETYNLIGACYRSLNQPLFAIPFLWAALTLKPDYDLALTNLGLCCEKLRLNKSAACYFEHPAVKNSTNPWVRSSCEKFLKHHN